MSGQHKTIAIELENRLLDYLMDGEASMADAAHELRKSATVLFRVASRLRERGLLDHRLCRSHYGRPELRWFHAKTRKVA